MKIKAKLTDETGWQMILTPTETAALIENAGSSISLLDSFEIGAIEFGGGRFVIRCADVLVQRYKRHGRIYWTAYCPAGNWASCPCDDWREERDCFHVAALQDRATEPPQPLGKLLQFPTDEKAPETAPTAPRA